jgi:hypothetical protein
MDTFYVRHTQKMDVDSETLAYLWEKQKIAIHFPHRGKDHKLEESDNDSLNPTDYYGEGRRAMNAFCRLSREGGYVLTEYCHRPECLIGIVNPGTQIELAKGHWGKLWECEGREAILKTLQLSNVKIIPRNQSAQLLAGRPRQGTAMRWPNARDLIKNRVCGVSGQQTIRDLTPTYQEVLCAELLRLPSNLTGLPQLAHLILPVGRTMPDLDIYGIDTNGDLIAAQVTMQLSINCPGKVASLKQFRGENTKCIFFCEDSVSQRSDGIYYYSLDEAYKKFVIGSAGQKWLERVSCFLNDKNGDTSSTVTIDAMLDETQSFRDSLNIETTCDEIDAFKREGRM